MAGCRLRGVGAAVSLLLPTLAASILPLVRGGSRSGVARYVGRLHPNHAWVPLGPIRLRYEQGDLPLVPDLSTLIEEAVVAPLAVSRSSSSLLQVGLTGRSYPLVREGQTAKPKG